LKVKEINPIITKQYTNNSVRGTKTDKTDAEILAKIGVIE
jgi:transposase